MSVKFSKPNIFATDLELVKKTIKSGWLTHGKNTSQFENEFKKYTNSKYAVTVSSCTAALHLSCLALNLKKGDEVIVPAMSHTATSHAVEYTGAKAVFADIDLRTGNIDPKKIVKKITKKTKAIMLVHVLGNTCNMETIMRIKKKYNLFLIEDTCESLGTKYNNKYLGTFGEFSSFSFYSSHQISSGEGGMICCKNTNDYNIIKSLRSHGWSRGTSYENKIYKKNKFLDKKFIFFNSGYNLRPTEISAAIGLSQFKKLNEFIKLRKINRKKIITAMNKNSHIKNKLDFFNENLNVDPSWFGIPIKIIDNKIKKNILIKNLEKNGIETRPIISGNFAKQPAAIKYGLAKNQKFPNTDDVYNKSFFIGLPTKHIKNNFIDKIILAFEKSL